MHGHIYIQRNAKQTFKCELNRTVPGIKSDYEKLNTTLLFFCWDIYWDKVAHESNLKNKTTTEQLQQVVMFSKPNLKWKAYKYTGWIGLCTITSDHKDSERIWVVFNQFVAMIKSSLWIQNLKRK